MRAIPTDLAAHLAGGTTTLCHCWRLITVSGSVVAFTDHDRDISFNGTRYAAASGFEASATGEEVGLPAGSSNVAGAFSSDALTETDLLAGRYDGARVEVYQVNWANPDQRLLLRVQELGEVQRSGAAFRVELRPITHQLQQTLGRVYTRTCSASFGESGCNKALQAGQDLISTTLVAVLSETRIVVSGTAGFPEGAFSRGIASMHYPTDNDIIYLDINRHSGTGDSATLDLWLPMTVIPPPGLRVQLTVGCDKTFATCRNRFSNGLNFRGFPHLPGPDFAYSYADGETVHDGGVLFP
nr:DUF2163 domain-containing protein [uncultured Gellertiella sp.]